MIESRIDREQGSLSLFFVVAMAALFIAIGLVVDGGGKMRTSQRVDAVAAEAARAGAQAITSDALVHGTPPQVEAARAVTAANDYLADAGMQGSVQVSGTSITVTATTSYAPIFLSAIGIGDQTVTGQATVELVRDL